MDELKIKSSLDGRVESSLFDYPENGRNVPLVVGLHTWSHGRDNQVNNYLPLCQARNWALLLPEFRGANLSSNPKCYEACGALPARQDIMDAVDYVRQNYSIDGDNIFLLGCSGGGHMALLMGAFAPELWRAIKVWCPVVDLVSWFEYYGRHNSYAAELEACLGAIPEENMALYRERSPIFQVEKLKDLPIYLHHGKHDGVVPCEDSKRFIKLMEGLEAPEFYYDIFDGGHEQYPPESFRWFDRLVNMGGAGIKITG